MDQENRTIQGENGKNEYINKHPPLKDNCPKDGLNEITLSISEWKAYDDSRKLQIQSDFDFPDE